MSRRHHAGGVAFFCVVAACWLVGVFGLERERLSSFQLPLIAVAGFLVYGIVVAIRHHVDSGRDHLVHTPDPVVPRTCVVLRQFGEDQKVTHEPPTAVTRTPAPARAASTVRHHHRPSRKRLDYIPISRI